MDTSEIYVKMCDCEEIFGEWEKYCKNYYPIDLEKNYFAQPVEPNSIALAPGIWLPQQDDIQRMIQPTLRNAHTFERHWHVLLKELQDWWNLNPEHVANLLSMEQLWLAFYMHEKHKKLWSSKEEKWHSG